MDVDFEGILDYKLEALAGEIPHCEYRSRPADLTNGDARRRTWGKRVDQGNAIFRSTGEEAHRLGRDMPGGPLWRLLGRIMPAAKYQEMRRMAGIVLLERV